MKIPICKPAGFNEPGTRPNNEDSIYPSLATATDQDRLFLVCDGVGGEHKGEVASKLACNVLADYFRRVPSVVDDPFIQSALEYTRLQFENMERHDPATQGMATTLTLLYFDETTAIIAHLGDSRVYQFRNGRIIFKTKDHKWVNDLVETGLLSEQQALEHPKRNVITKVISAARHDKAEVSIITDLRQGDYFFMCTDGVLEQLYDELLQYHFGADASKRTPEQILSLLKEECEGKTNDNFSAYLIRLKKDKLPGQMLPGSENAKVLNAGLPIAELQQTSDIRSGGFLYPFLFFVAASILITAIYYYVHTQQG